MVIKMRGVYMLGFNSIPEAIMFLIAAVISFTIHEYSHGIVSYIQGDPTPKNEGRLTLNPVSHIDLYGLLAIMIAHFGWAKPVPYVSKYYKNKRIGIALTSVAGPLSNFLLAIVASLIYVIINSDNYITTYFFSNLIELNIILALLNMIPIPPLDGSKLVASIFGGSIAEFIYRIQRIGIIIVFLLFLFPPVSNAFFSFVYFIENSLVSTVALLVHH